MRGLSKEAVANLAACRECAVKLVAVAPAHLAGEYLTAWFAEQMVDMSDSPKFTEDEMYFLTLAAAAIAELVERQRTANQ